MSKKPLCDYCKEKATTEVRASAVKKKGIKAMHIYHCDRNGCIIGAKMDLAVHAKRCSE